LVRFALAKARSLAMKRAIIGGMSLAGSTVACGFLGERLGIEGKVTVDGGGKLDGDLHRLVVRHGGEFQLGHGAGSHP